MKRAAAINDISGLGKCSLTADIAVLSAMGVQVCPVPTGIYTAQTAYPGYIARNTADMLPSFEANWSELGEKFDGILTGFLPDAVQADAVFSFVKAFKTSDTLLLVDPVMADNGEKYPNNSPMLEKKIKELAHLADILTPNVSELCILADANMNEVLALKGPALLERLEQLAGSAAKEYSSDLVVTGIHLPGDAPGGKRIGNLVAGEEGTFLVALPASEGSFSGTGDLFASVLLGGALRGLSRRQTVETAAEFIRVSVADSVRRGTQPREGIDFEPHLSLLMEAVSR